MTQMQAISPLEQLERLGSKVQALVKEESELLGVARQAKADMARLAVEIAECDALLQRKDDVQHALLALQMKVQAKNKGVYEDLLTSLIHEIMPGKAGDKIVLSSSMRNNLAALDIDIMSKGNLENVNRDKGGSIANIVAMGLRFVVLARHPNRRVLFLDEADCHLNEMYIPAFAAVMNQLAHRLGIQVVYISHHPAAYFSGYGRITEIYNEAGKNHARMISDEILSDDVEYPDSALRYIRVKDFGPHENVMVDLGPGLNIIVGDNDLGKSKFITAVAELLENEGNESRIRHERPHFEVELGLEEGMSLIWTYARKGSNKSNMILKDKAGKTIESSNVGRGKIPDWLHTYLAMGLVNDQNIHVHPQDEPKYLLASHYSAIDRAKMLPMGRESRDVQRMIQIFTQKIADARQRKSGYELEINRVKNLLKVLSPLLDAEAEGDNLLRTQKELQAQFQRTTQIRALGARWGQTEKVVKLLRQGLEQLSQHILVPVQLMATQELGDLIKRYEKNTAMIKVLEPIKKLRKAISPPAIRDTKAIAALGARWGKNAKMIQVLNKVKDLPEAQAPNINDLSAQQDLISRMEANAKAIQGKREGLKACEEQGVKLRLQRAELMTSLGGICPTCQQTLEGHVHG
jgi:predicted ATP-dependent endonuclease of OLD family